MSKKHKVKKGTEAQTASAAAVTAAKVPVETKEKKKGVVSFFLNSESVLELVLKSALLLVIPYLYLLFCGLVFDKWLKLYSLTSFIFWSLIVLYIAAAAIIIYAVVRFVGGRRKK